MPCDPRHEILFEQVRIGPKTLPNRFYQVPHCTGFGVEKPWSQASHRAVKAEGGWGAVCTEYCTVSPDSDETPYVSARMWDDLDVRALAVMCDAAHELGALAGIELSHTGVHGENSESRLPAMAPSQIASDFAAGVVPKAMTKRDIRRLREDWGAAARRSRTAGFDIVYVYGAHTYLPGQFLSPHYNRRTDEYGGSLRNRARFWLEMLEAVREAVGDDCAVACRVAVDRLGALGVDLDEGLEFVALADPLVDLWDVTVGSISEWALDSGPSRFFEEGWQLGSTGRVREATAKPIVGVGRLTSPDLMADIVRSGVWDLIGAARPSIADPFLPAKIREGRVDEIRECIGCNICISKADSRRHIGCTQNPTAGEEHRRGWHPERVPPLNKPLRALVVGAGPSGMECAITLAQRGASVDLVERAPLTGGSLGLITRLPGLGEWGRIGAYRAVQMKRLPNLELLTGTELDADAIRAWDADVVILATGSAWSQDGLNPFTREPIPGADASLPHVLTPEQVVLDGKRPPEGPVIVYDGEGYYTAPAIAELLAAEGRQVELVTGHDVVAPFCAETLEDVLTRLRVHDAGVSMRTGTVITAVEPGRMPAENAFGEPLEIAAAGIVLVTQRVSRDALFHELDGTVPRLHRVGDCVAPRLLAEAIFDGHRMAREIESADPDVALPYLRERPLQEPPAPPAAAPPAVALKPRADPRRRPMRLLDGGPEQIAAGIRALVADAGDVVVAAGRGAGADLEPYRRLAQAWGGTFAVSRPQVEAARATRTELVGASSLTVAPALYVAFGISGAVPHLVGMSESSVVVAVNTDSSARIFEHADVGAVADAGEVVTLLLETL
ncbi:MAG: dimethylamine/trimethylamine dehydrogenase [Gaiellales bacterium]|jgi:dimethylamine/trimethylamine dehydrogenase|nr:dimethylamine/trimethylamine dehydrogenase [Gaiellales bacterium]